MLKTAALLLFSILHCGQCQVYPSEWVATVADGVALRAGGLELGGYLLEAENTGNNTDNNTGTEAPATAASIAQGTILSVTGGTGYAFGALVVSWSGRAVKTGTITPERQRVFSGIAWLIMCAGGLCVTFAYTSGASVPLMNSFVYATNLGLNMIFQITFKLTPYTKEMRCGTILFALTAVQLSQIALSDPDYELVWLLDPPAMIWNSIFLVIWLVTTVQICRSRHLPPNDPGKILAWAVHVACWGAFTDNWAKINGKLDGTAYLISFVFAYLPVSGGVMILSVMAMGATNVALYVPTNLCCQLTMNTISALVTWKEASNVYGDNIGLLIAVMVGYIICIMSVYIATEQADLLSSLSNGRELRAKGLSAGTAQTPFGESLVALAAQWNEKEKVEEAAPSPEAKEVIEQFLSTGAAAKVFNQKELVDLSMRLWSRVNPSYGATATVVSWMSRTPYFTEYLAADAAFTARLTGPLSPEERKAMEQDNLKTMEMGVVQS